MPSSAKSRSRMRDLYARAQSALESNDVAGALTAFAGLEKLDEANPEWPRRLAKLHRHRGDVGSELDALIRCADRYAARQEFIPALATYKMILSTDPGHVVAQQRLSELQPETNSVSVRYSDEERPAAARDRVGTPGEETAPLDELVLTDIVEGALPVQLGESDLGVHEIPLEMVVAESPPRPAPVTEGAAASTLEAGSAEDIARLERTPLFGSLDRQSLTKLVEQVRLVELRAGQELFHQGDTAGELYVVARGAVVPIAEEEGRTRLAVLEAGEFFGEIALFTNQPRNATIEALVDSQLLCIDRAVMWRLVQDHAQVLALLLQFLRERLIQRLVRTSPLFQIFSSAKRSSVIRRFRFLEVSDGHAVIEQHMPAEAIFILLSGQMEVLHREGDPGETSGAEKVLATLGPGELFGEMSLLWREPSLASVIARGKCWLLALPAESFREMLDHHPQLAAMASQLANERREQNKRTLRDALQHRDGKAGII